MSDPNRPADTADAAAARQRRRVTRRDARLRVWGLRSWWLIGILVAASLVSGLLGAVSGLVVPLIVAVVVGMLFAPAVDVLARAMPRVAAAVTVLVGLIALTSAVLVVAVAGVIDQAPEIGHQLAAGFDQVSTWLSDLDLTVGDGDGFVGGLADLYDMTLPGLVGQLGTVFSSTAAFLAGTLAAVFLLYFVLADWDRLAAWAADHLGVDPAVGREIVDDATWSIRQYFVALTVASLIVAVIVGAAAAIIGIPLALPIALITMLTAYVPYIGAIFSGAFAVLIALGSGGLGDAILILAVVLVAQNVVQTIVQTKMSEGRLALHPIVIFGSTIAGGATLGLLGAALSTPVVALLVRVNARLAPPAGESGDQDGDGRDGA